MANKDFLKEKGIKALSIVMEKSGQALSAAKETSDKIVEKGRETSDKLAEKSKETIEKVNTVIKPTASGKIEELKSKLPLKAKDSNESSETEQNESKKMSLDDELHREVDTYNMVFAALSDQGMDLQIQRERAVDLISNIENLINSIANHPKEFDKTIQEVEIHRKEFVQTCDFAKEELQAAKKSAVSSGAGAAAGAAVATLAPTAAMWVATTFGTASTGTAISTLSGAAATNAAVAWLGGGALSAGGGGIAAGNALLALAGPIGWSIAGATLLTSVVLFANKRVKINKQKIEEIEAVKRNTESLKESLAMMGDLHDKTNMLREKLSEQYSSALQTYGHSFTELSESQQLLLGALVNNTLAMAASLGQNINAVSE